MIVKLVLLSSIALLSVAPSDVSCSPLDVPAPEAATNDAIFRPLPIVFGPGPVVIPGPKSAPAPSDPEPEPEPVPSGCLIASGLSTCSMVNGQLIRSVPNLAEIDSQVWSSIEAHFADPTAFGNPGDPKCLPSFIRFKCALAFPACDAPIHADADARDVAMNSTADFPSAPISPVALLPTCMSSCSNANSACAIDPIFAPYDCGAAYTHKADSTGPCAPFDPLPPATRLQQEEKVAELDQEAALKKQVQESEEEMMQRAEELKSEEAEAIKAGGPGTPRITKVVTTSTTAVVYVDVSKLGAESKLISVVATPVIPVEHRLVDMAPPLSEISASSPVNFKNLMPGTAYEFTAMSFSEAKMGDVIGSPSAQSSVAKAYTAKNKGVSVEQRLRRKAMEQRGKALEELKKEILLDLELQGIAEVDQSNVHQILRETESTLMKSELELVHSKKTISEMEHKKLQHEREQREEEHRLMGAREAQEAKEREEGQTEEVREVAIETLEESIAKREAEIEMKQEQIEKKQEVIAKAEETIAKREKAIEIQEQAVQEKEAAIVQKEVEAILALSAEAEAPIIAP